MPDQDKKPKIKRSLFRKIINVFISIFLGFVLLSIIFVGFSQTFTFRNWLREKAISIANKELNGKINIEKIDGTILTSIFLRNTSIVMDNDTLLIAKNIEIKTSPLQLLTKRIYFRKILLEDLKINFLQDSSGSWNFARLIKPKEKDTTESSFPFTIQVNDFRLKNIIFKRQSYANLNSSQIYKTINFDDLRVDNIYLSAQAFLDIDNSDYLLQLKEFSFKPNLTRFTLQNISGNFALTKNFVDISQFAFITDSSDVRINLRLDSLNIFGETKLEDFKNCPTTMDLNASSFNFDDLSSFLDATEILKGNPSLKLKGHGKFGHINIDKAVLDYKSTHFEFSGEVLNLNVPSRLYIKTRIKDTDINYKDVNLLLPSLLLPEFAKLSVSSVNVEYEGEPTNFKTKFSGNVENGKLEFDCSMNLNSKPTTYDINFETTNMDLMPVIGITTSLNSVGSLTGKGFSPAELSSKFNIDITNSLFNKIPINEFAIKSKAENKKIDLTLEGNSKNSNAYIIGQIVFDKDTIPTYSLTGSINQLDLSSFMDDLNYRSNLNFYFGAEGKNFNPDKITGLFSFGIDSSKYRNVNIPGSNIDLILKTDSSGRSINLVSDFVDFNINGNFSLSKAVELIAYEARTISNVISNKLDELNPLNIVDQSGRADSVETTIPQIVDEKLKFDYDFKFKKFDLIAALIGNERLDIVGSGKGSIDNSSPNFNINSLVNLNYIIFMQKGLTVYISDILLDMKFKRDNRFLSFDNLSGTVSLTGKRFYSTVNIKDINADIVFNESKLAFNLSAGIEDNINVATSGNILMTPIQQQILIDKFKLFYNGFDWNNNEQIKIFFNPYHFNIAQFSVMNDSSSVEADGTIDNNGTLDLNLKASRLSGKIISKYMFGINNPDLIANGKIKATIRGELDNPEIYSSCSIANLSYRKFSLGNLEGKFDYADKKIKTEFSFLDSTFNYSKPLMSLKGTIPIDLSFGTVGNRFPENESINLVLKSENFNLRSIGNLIPLIENQSGILNADVAFTGSLENPIYDGYINLNNGFFRSVQNNLDYNCQAKLKFANSGITIENISIENAGGTPYPGKMDAEGLIKFNKFDISELAVKINGDLAVLSQQSREVNPRFYGDLAIGTNGSWEFTKRGEKYFFNGNIILKQTDLIYTTTQEQSSNSGNFNFIYVVDSTKIDKELIRFHQVLSAEKSNLPKTQSEVKQLFNFDYEIGVSIKDRAHAVFIISQAANQKLYVDMMGDLKYESFNSETNAQGAFELMNGSKLEFLGKTFDATGLIRFESDITNPYLDITATYQSEYINPQDSKSTPEEVAVKLKIKGPLSDLGKNLSTNQESIGVYYGIRNIQNDVRDKRYDYSDAFSFVLFGKFKDDLTARDKTAIAGQSTNVIGNTANSLLGSVLTSFVNSAVGDLISNIQISNNGDYTKFILSGRTQSLRYSFGGTTEVFQNIGKANFKLEYGTNFLIRLERRDPIANNYSFGDKITEIALKYKFEF